MNLETWIALLIGALGASILTLFAGFLGERRESKREHARWVREQRFEAYRDFLRVAERLPSIAMDKTPDERDLDYLENMHDAVGKIRLVGPDAVIDVAVIHLDRALKYAREQSKTENDEEATTAAHREYDRTRTAVVSAARSQLGMNP